MVPLGHLGSIILKLGKLKTDLSSFYKIACFLFLLNSCQSEKINIQPAFYHWQTHLSLSTLEKNYLADLAVQKIYPKFFDVDWDFNQQMPVALASISFSSSLPDGLTVVPTVFITNRTLSQLPIEQLADLAHKIAQKLKGKIQTLPNVSIQEIQFDCDWTQSTKTKYFGLLQLLNQVFQSKGIQVSATIRLHQIKYPQKTGVPPVHRGMLMYYNMGEVQKITTANSILDNEIGAKYLAQLNAYPLPLDVALPLFQWGVLFRNDKMIKLLNQLTPSTLSDRQRFSKINKNNWEVTKSTYLNGVYLYKNDQIRLEKSELSDLKIAANLLQDNLKMEDRTIALYHLDSTVIMQFEVAELENIIGQFEKQNNWTEL